MGSWMLKDLSLAGFMPISDMAQVQIILSKGLAQKASLKKALNQLRTKKPARFGPHLLPPASRDVSDPLLLTQRLACIAPGEGDRWLGEAIVGMSRVMGASERASDHMYKNTYRGWIRVNPHQIHRLILKGC